MDEITELEEQIQTLMNKLHALRRDQTGEKIPDYVFTTFSGLNQHQF